MQVQGVNENGEKFSERSESFNIGTGGVYYKTLQKLFPGTEATVTFDLPFDNVGNFRILKTRGRVVRIDKNQGEGKGIGIRTLTRSLVSGVPSRGIWRREPGTIIQVRGPGY